MHASERVPRADGRDLARHAHARAASIYTYIAESARARAGARARRPADYIKYISEVGDEEWRRHDG